MEIQDFKKNLKPRQSLLGFDFGTKRLGTAVSDLLLMIATSHKTIYRSDWDTDLAEIKKIIAEKEVGGLVFGLPLQMDGTEGETAKQVREFADKLSQATGLPCAFWDERLSSRAMESFLIKEVDLSRRRRKEVLDSSSASYILQGFLDALPRF